MRSFLELELTRNQAKCSKNKQTKKKKNHPNKNYPQKHAKYKHMEILWTGEMVSTSG